MGKQRKTWSAEVKEQIILSVLRGELSTAEAARQHGVNESRVHTWKANFLDAGRARLAGERQDHGHAALERENARLVAELGRQAREDALTGLPNRRSFTEALEKAFTHARRYERPLAVALADVDDFKKINDRFSHAVGDEVLKTVAALFRGALRDGDLAARVGGEEFAFVFPETDEQEARATDADDQEADQDRQGAEGVGPVVPRGGDQGARADPEAEPNSAEVAAGEELLVTSRSVTVLRRR